MKESERKIKLKLISLMLSVTFILGLTACGANTESSPAKNDTSTQESTSTDVRTVTDILGRDVEVPTEVNRIACIGPSRLVFYAAGLDKLVGCTEAEMKLKANMPYAYVCHDIISECTPCSKSAGSKNSIYVENIVDLDPDVVFYFNSCSTPEDADALQDQIGIPVVYNYASDFNSDDFFQSLKTISEVMGTEDRADKITSTIKEWIQDLENRTQDIAENDKPVVYVGGLTAGSAHGIESTWCPYGPFTAISTKNVADEAGDGYFDIDIEKLAVWDPDYIFLDLNNMSYVNEEYEENPDFYDSLSAVKNGNLYSQISYNMLGRNMELALLDAYYTGTVIYPEQFADIDAEAKAKEIFSVMLGEDNSDYMDILKENGFSFGSVTIGK